MTCWKCGRAIPLLSGERVGIRDVCPGCDADLHVCRNCRHFDPSAHGECREDQAEPVRYKDRSNPCDYFTPLTVVGGARRAETSRADDAKKRFDQLFK